MSKRPFTALVGRDAPAVPAARPTPSGSAELPEAFASRVLRVTRDPDADPAVLRDLMDVARAKGATATARALRDRLKIALEKRRPAAPASSAGREVAAPEPELPGEGAVRSPEPTGQSGSPLPGVDDAAWERFSAAVAAGRPLDSEEGGRLGMYATSVRRLADLGIVEDPRKVRAAPGPDGKRRSDTWEADWKRVPKRAFLESTRAQHGVFRRSMSDYAEKIRGTELGRALGKDLGNDKKITLSGLLAVAHVAGSKGLESWLRDPETRKKFPNTTRVFGEANGIF